MKTFFIGLGFKKCATTWLAMRLTSHPTIWYPPIRELQYLNNFDSLSDKLPLQTKRYITGWSNQASKLGHKDKKKIISLIDKMNYWKKYANTKPDSIETYRNLFEPSDSDLAYGEITPDYAGLSEEMLKNIYNMREKPKVFLIMREPIERAVSQIQHEGKLQPNRVSTPDKILTLLDSDIVKKQADYARVIRRIKSIFPEDRIGYFFFEDMVTDQKKYLQTICEFLEVDFHEKMMVTRKHTKSNKKIVISDEVIKKATELYGHVAGEVKELLGRVPDDWEK